jgi:hypothetical protein
MTTPPPDLAQPAPSHDASPPRIVGFGDEPPAMPLPQLSPPAAKKRPRRQRGNVEQFRTDDAEHAALVEKARAAGLSLGAYYRSVLIGDAGARAKRAPPTEASRARALNITSINRVGNLLNQGIRALNDTGRRAPEAGDRDRLADEIAATRELLQSTLPALKEALALVLSGDDREG